MHANMMKISIDIYTKKFKDRKIYSFKNQPFRCSPERPAEMELVHLPDPDPSKVEEPQLRGTLGDGRQHRAVHGLWEVAHGQFGHPWYQEKLQRREPNGRLNRLIPLKDCVQEVLVQKYIKVSFWTSFTHEALTSHL